MLTVISIKENSKVKQVTMLYSTFLFKVTHTDISVVTYGPGDGAASVFFFMYLGPRVLKEVSS